MNTQAYNLGKQLAFEKVGLLGPRKFNNGEPGKNQPGSQQTSNAGRIYYPEIGMNPKEDKDGGEAPYDPVSASTRKARVDSIWDLCSGKSNFNEDVTDFMPSPPMTAPDYGF